MLVMTRKPGEAVVLGDAITVRILAVEGPRVKIAIGAPPDVIIVREELLQRSPAPPRPAAPQADLVVIGMSSAEGGATPEPIYALDISKGVPVCPRCGDALPLYRITADVWACGVCDIWLGKPEP